MNKSIKIVIIVTVIVIALLGFCIYEKVFVNDKTGGKIKSEAGMMADFKSAIMFDEVREFAIDDTFAIFLKEEGKENPYFAGKISDITKFQ